MKNLSELYLRINPNRYHYLKFILEGYDNLAVLSMYNPALGIVVLRYPLGTTQDLYVLLSSLAPCLTYNHHQKNEN